MEKRKCSNTAQESRRYEEKCSFLSKCWTSTNFSIGFKIILSKKMMTSTNKNTLYICFSTQTCTIENNNIINNTKTKMKQNRDYKRAWNWSNDMPVEQHILLEHALQFVSKKREGSILFRSVSSPVYGYCTILHHKNEINHQ